jgi:hypothetical protein
MLQVILNKIKSLHQPTILPVPEFELRIMYGQAVLSFTESIFTLLVV